MTQSTVAMFATIGILFWPATLLYSLAKIMTVRYREDRRRLAEAKQDEAEMLQRIRAERRLEQEQLKAAMKELEREL